MICNVDNIASYAVPHDSSNVLGRGLSSINIIKKVRLVSQEAKGNALWYFEAVREGVDLALYAQLLLSALRSKLLSSEVYYSKAKPWSDVAMLVFTKIASQKVTRL